MAASSTSLIDDFVKFSKIIALELESKDIELLKFLIQNKIPKPRLAEIETGLQLISLLKEYRLLSENNLDYLIELLAESRRIDLADRVIEYRNNSVNVVRNAPEAQIEERLPAPNMELLHLIFLGQIETITIANIEHIKQSICSALQFKISEIFYITASNCNPGCTVKFQLPSAEDKLRQLQWDALNKEPWLTNLDLIELKVDSKSSINFKN